ncbi:MAG: DUF167 domain-containing protein [Planctomycetes bacterium]|nr:DUF167 domain-containing protein [Planctomycetota bacterium]
MSDFELVARGAETDLPVRVQPGASKARVVGVWNGKVKIAVTAPPDKGRANEELVEFVAELLGLRASAVRLASGERSRDKRLAITAAPEQVRAALRAKLG